MKVVLIAGGKGTRIRSVASDIPKPMIPIEGKPVLEHQLECLKKQGFCDIILTVSYMADVIMDYFGDGSNISPVTGEPFGVNITYFVEEEPLGNAGALFKIADQLSEDFLLLIADAMFHIDFERFIAAHEKNKKNGGLVTLFTHPNSHPYDSGLIFADEDHRVTKWLNKEDVRPKFYKNRVNAGMHVLNKKVLSAYGIDGEKVGTIDEATGKVIKVDMDRDLFRPLLEKGAVFAYDSPEYVKDMGTPDRYEAVCRDVREGIVEARNLAHKQKAVFLDRDGTINKHIGFLTDIDQMELEEGAAKAIAQINAAGFLAIVITNQPVIARGEVTWEELEEIHNKMETLLGKEGAYLDAIYFCPHHPDKGFPGEVAELKIDCECRKPKPGLILQAAKDFNIDIASSWMVGDTKRDVGVGLAAGCHTALIGEEDFGQEINVKNLLDFSQEVLYDKR